MLWPALLPKARRICRDVSRGALPSQPLLNLLPHRIVNNPQMRGRSHDMLRRRLGARMGLAGDRVADLVTAVPHNLADVEALAQHAIGLALCAADGDLVPALASGPGNAGLVQPSRDGQRAQPRRVIAKNVTDDIGSLGINLAQTTFWLAIGPEHTCYPPIAINHAAC